MRIVGAIPAAGYGTRLRGHLDGSKELALVRGTPVIDYIAERMRIGGATELRVVTRPEKHDLVDHVTALGATVLLAHPDSVSSSMAIATAGLDDDDVVLLGFPDTVWAPVDGFRRLVDALDATCEAALGLFRIPASELCRSDVVVARNGWVERVHVKPTRPQSEWIWGCAAARAGALDGLAGHAWPGEHFDLLSRNRGRVRGLALSGSWLDIGTPEALRLVQGDAHVLRAPT